MMLEINGRPDTGLQFLNNSVSKLFYLGEEKCGQFERIFRHHTTADVLVHNSSDSCGYINTFLEQPGEY